MDSAAIAKFLESTYPDPPVLLSSPLSQETEPRVQRVLGEVYKTSLTPRESGILSPSAQDYFRRTREASLGHPIQELLSGNKENERWDAAEEELRATGGIISASGGLLVLGKKPYYTDFVIAGALQCARMIDEGVFERTVAFSGYGEIYEACVPFIEQKKD